MSNKNIRKRGVVASRAKLEKAMLAAGIKTQLALAKAIAANEDQDPDNPPRDMVNKVFRGRSVDPQNIERIASVLQIDSYKLYLSKEEAAVLTETANNDNTSDANSVSAGIKNVESENTANYGMQISKIKWLSFSAIVVVALLSIGYFTDWIFVNEKQSQISNSPIKFTFQSEKPLVALIGNELADFAIFNEQLSQLTKQQINLKTSNVNHVNASLNPWQLAEKLNVDFVVQISKQSIGRIDTITVHAFNASQKVMLYADVFSQPSINEVEIAEKTSKTLLSLVDASPTNQLDEVVPIEAVLALQEGLNMFDQPLGTSALGIAMTNIYRAINLAPDYINAKSALCYGLIARYTTKREDALLVEAEKACNALKEIAINSPRYHTANGYLQDNLQDLPGAIAAFEKALEIEPNFVDAMNGLAETYLTKGSRERSREIILKGLAIANEASKVSPLFWKPPYIKARIYYISGQPDLAISESEKSIEIEPNYANLNNGASINFCFGDPAVALQMYERAVTLKFSRPELHYNLASTYSYFEDYESASEHIDTYFNLLEQENSDANLDGYIGAGDVHRLAQNYEKASELYQIAFSKAENERLQGDESPDLRSKLLYLEIMNATLSSPETVKTKQSEYINQLDDLVPLVVNPNSIMRLLFAYSELSQFDSAKALYLKIAPICKGFADAAAFARFRE